MTKLFGLSFFTLLLLSKPIGQYSGTWTSDNGANSGKVNLSLTESGENQLTFTFQDQLVKPRTITATVSDDQVDFICALDIEGFHLKTAFHGTVDGTTVSGKYQSTNADDGSKLDSGTWKVTQQ